MDIFILPMIGVNYINVQQEIAKNVKAQFMKIIVINALQIQLLHIIIVL